MPYEAPLIQRLGFEIYVPKVIPKSNFRSGAIDFSYDSSLSLPPAVLPSAESLQFLRWGRLAPANIATIVNRYFGTAFVIPHARQVSEAVDKFEGQIVFRAFGLDNSQSYKKLLDDLYGPLVLRKIKAIKERFWFGEGYDNLHECDDSLFAERALFLPIGVPDSVLLDRRGVEGIREKDSVCLPIRRFESLLRGDLPALQEGLRAFSPRHRWRAGRSGIGSSRSWLRFG